jgi:hypothetical protein
MKIIKTGAIALAVVLAAYFGYRYFLYQPPIKNPRPAGENIVCFGDSLTYGTGASQGMDYPTQLSCRDSIGTSSAAPRASSSSHSAETT